MFTGHFAILTACFGLPDTKKPKPYTSKHKFQL